jgi:hypothetical protein
MLIVGIIPWIAIAVAGNLIVYNKMATIVAQNDLMFRHGYDDSGVLSKMLSCGNRFLLICRKYSYLTQEQKGSTDWMTITKSLLVIQIPFFILAAWCITQLASNK